MKLLQGLAMSGVSGNMLIGALLDYGVPFEYLEKQLAKLNLAGYRLVCEKRNKLGITGTYFNVILGEDDHDHAHGDDHHHDHDHHHDSLADHVHPHDHNHPHVHGGVNDYMKAVAEYRKTFASKQDVLEQTPDPAVREMLLRMEQIGCDTTFDRFDRQKPQCTFGLAGVCCKNCNMGPCKITPKTPLGVCGADADLIVCRAGASTVTEIAAVGAAAVYVPFPAAVDDHQTSNARFLVDAGGGWLQPQSTLSAQGLAEMLQNMQRATLLERAELAKKMQKTDATAKVVAACEELAA